MKSDVQKTVSMTSRSNHHSLPSTSNPNYTMKAASSSTNTLKVTNAPHADSLPLSPLPHHGKRPSLAGFDPLLTSGAPSSSSYSHLSECVSGSTMNLHMIAETSASTSHRYPSLSNPSSPHVATSSAESGMKQTFFPLQTIVNINLDTTPSHASESSTARSSGSQRRAEVSEKRSHNGRDSSLTRGGESDTRQPPTPSKSRQTPKLRIDKTGISFGVDAALPKEDDSKASKGTSPKSQLSPIARKLHFRRNKGSGHRRTKSLESNEDIKDFSLASQNNFAAQSQGHRGSLPNSPTSVPDAPGSNVVDTKTSLLQELMDLKDKFSALQIPSLARPSPTSFLTGKGDEAVRTSEYEPSPFQMEIPSLPEVVETARLNDFVENYRRMDQNFDLTEFIGYSRMDLQRVKVTGRVAIAQSLLDCGDGLTVQGFISKGTDCDERLEAVVVEGQRHFTVIFRGTTEEQTKLMGNVKAKKRAIPLDTEQENVEVYSGFKEEYSKLEHDCFSLIDKLSEQNPFCDFVFTGYSFGAAMATLAAYRYANARPTMRVSCVTFASPKVGFSLFRHLVHSLPNLKVIRLEHGQDAKCQGPSAGGWHVGHTLVLSGPAGQNSPKTQNKPVLAYKFDTSKHKKFKTTHPDLSNYVTTLEEMARLNVPWVKDFANTSGNGVVVNNEARQVV